MKKLLVPLVALFALALGACVTVDRQVVVERPVSPPPAQAVAPAPAPEPAPVEVASAPVISSSDYFYDPLTPYGVWVASPRFGTVWVPHRHLIGDNWRPYTYGHWELTEYGWTWLSEEPWGWAVYHYGRWGWDPGYGWVWAPGTVWGPAWVYWRTGDAYMGWAPMGPGAEVGMAVAVAAGAWIFIESAYFLDAHMHHHIIYGPRAHDCYGNTVYYDHHRGYHGHDYYYGPDHNYVNHHTHQVVTTHSSGDLDERHRPTYRPPDAGRGGHGDQSGTGHNVTGGGGSGHGSQPVNAQGGHGDTTGNTHQGPGNADGQNNGHQGQGNPGGNGNAHQGQGNANGQDNDHQGQGNAYGHGNDNARGMANGHNKIDDVAPRDAPNDQGQNPFGAQTVDPSRVNPTNPRNPPPDVRNPPSDRNPSPSKDPARLQPEPKRDPTPIPDRYQPPAPRQEQPRYTPAPRQPAPQQDDSNNSSNQKKKKKSDDKSKDKGKSKSKVEKKG